MIFFNVYILRGILGVTGSEGGKYTTEGSTKVRKTALKFGCGCAEVVLGGLEALYEIVFLLFTSNTAIFM